MTCYRKFLVSCTLWGAVSLLASGGEAAELIPCPVAGSTNLYGEPFVITNNVRGLDDSSQRIDQLSDIFPEGIKFQNTVYSTLYLNINGNVSFGSARSTYTPIAIPGLNYPILAPFFADVELRNSSGGLYTCRDVANQRILFTWNDVGYYINNGGKASKKKNSFQMVITNTTDQCDDPNVTSVFDVQFRYKKLEWTTGSARSSGGVDGLGGKPATAGIDAGDRVHAVALPGSGTAAVLNLVNLSNVGVPGVFEYRVADGTLPQCGNGVLNLCEQCDEGAANDPHGSCTTLCMNAVCGDGFLQTGVEECDGGWFDPAFDECPAGFVGQPLCNNDPNNQQGDGTCTVSLYGCVDVDECVEMPGLCGSGTCENAPGGYACTCPAGYSFDGQTCVDVDECAETPGLCGSGTCENTPGGYTCTCEAGYSFDGQTCVDVDECAEGTHSCDANAECTNSPGSYACTCAAGYEGDGTSCSDVDECSDDALNTCDANAVCTNTVGGYTCACAAGYVGDGEMCSDVDECAEGTDSCDANAECTNSPGSYACTCAAGYEGDGTSCSDVDECSDDALNTCDANAVCTNTVGGYLCACAAGYVGDGRTCEDVDECADDALNTCDANAECTNTPGSYVCTCKTGYVGNGQVCGDRDCSAEELVRCGEFGSCAVADNVVMCVCAAGYALNDQGTCVDVDECADNALNTCDANAVCTNTSGGYECACAAGFVGDGRTCEDVDECADDALNTCDVNAECTNTPGGYLCACEEGYVGDGWACGDRECTDDEEATCGVYGSCAVTDNVVLCICTAGYALNAQGTCVDVDECAQGADLCGEHAVCTNTAGGYECVCETGYALDAQGACVDADECADGGGALLCGPSRACINTEGGYRCDCSEGFSLNGEACVASELESEPEQRLLTGGGMIACSAASGRVGESALSVVVLALLGFRLMYRRRWRQV